MGSASHAVLRPHRAKSRARRKAVQARHGLVCLAPYGASCMVR